MASGDSAEASDLGKEGKKVRERGSNDSGLSSRLGNDKPPRWA